MSDVMEKDIREIKYKVEGIDKSVDLLVRASRKQIVDDLLTFFGKSLERVQVFLSIDGEKSVRGIAQDLRLKPQNVSRRISELEREGLVRIMRTTRSTKIYQKTEKVTILNLENILLKKFGAAITGAPAGEAQTGAQERSGDESPA